MVNGEKLQSRAVTLTLIKQSQMSNPSQLFSDSTICKSFKELFFSYRESACLQYFKVAHMAKLEIFGIYGNLTFTEVSTYFQNQSLWRKFILYFKNFTFTNKPKLMAKFLVLLWKIISFYSAEN